MEGLAAYLPPAITDYGDLRAMTAVTHPLLGHVAGGADMSFSAPAGAVGGVSGEGGNLGHGTGGVSSHSGPGAGGALGGGGAGGGGSGGGGGGGGKLPFTGL